jgi:hypothetical protein
MGKLTRKVTQAILFSLFCRDMNSQARISVDVMDVACSDTRGGTLNAKQALMQYGKGHLKCGGIGKENEPLIRRESFQARREKGVEKGMEERHTFEIKVTVKTIRRKKKEFVLTGRVARVTASTRTHVSTSMKGRRGAKRNRLPLWCQLSKGRSYLL